MDAQNPGAVMRLPAAHVPEGIRAVSDAPKEPLQVTSKLHTEPDPERQPEAPASKNTTNNAIAGCMRTGAVMAALFPDGLQLRSEDDFAVFRLVDRLVGSVTHFAQTGLVHRTSMRDISTHAALIDEILATRDGKGGS